MLSRYYLPLDKLLPIPWSPGDQDTTLELHCSFNGKDCHLFFIAVNISIFNVYKLFFSS